MPIYEYSCPACGERAEKMRRISERADGPDCPACGETMTLGFSAPARVGGDGGSSASAGGACGTGFT